MKPEFMGSYAALGIEAGFLESVTEKWYSTFFSFDIRDKEHSEVSKMLRGNRRQPKKYICFFLKGTKEQVKNRSIITKLHAILDIYKKCSNLAPLMLNQPENNAGIISSTTAEMVSKWSAKMVHGHIY